MRERIKQFTPKQFVTLYKKARTGFLTLLFYLFRIFPISKKKIVFMNLWGYGDNTRYLAEEFVRRGADVTIVYITNHPSGAGADKPIRVRKTNSLRAVYALSTAKVWVEANRKEGYVRKRKGQYYVQAWHGGLPLKKIEGDCAEYLGSAYIKRAKWDSAMTDLYLSNGSFCTALYRRAFWYDGEVLLSGMPRNDMLLHPSGERIQQTKKMLHIAGNRKLAVYAPTFRESGTEQVYLKNIEKLLELLGEEYAICIRLHPLHNKGQASYQYSDTVINGSTCRDLYEILEAADLLITDYSNTMFEMAMAGKPVFLYAPDFQTYEKQRGLYFKREELPFSIAETEEALWEQIRMFQYDAYIGKTKKFLQDAGLYETGEAAKTAAERILQQL